MIHITKFHKNNSYNTQQTDLTQIDKK